MRRGMCGSRQTSHVCPDRRRPHWRLPVQPTRPTTPRAAATQRPHARSAPPLTRLFCRALYACLLRCTFIPPCVAALCTLCSVLCTASVCPTLVLVLTLMLMLMVLAFFYIPGPFCSVRGLRSDGVPGSPSPNELSQLVTTTDTHAHALWFVIVSVSIVVPPRYPSVRPGHPWF